MVYNKDDELGWYYVSSIALLSFFNTVVNEYSSDLNDCNMSSTTVDSINNSNHKVGIIR